MKTVRFGVYRVLSCLVGVGELILKDPDLKVVGLREEKNGEQLLIQKQRISQQ